MASARLLVTCLLAFFVTPVFAGDPHPPQLNISFLAQPEPIVQDGSNVLIGVSERRKGVLIADIDNPRGGRTI